MEIKPTKTQQVRCALAKPLTRSVLGKRVFYTHAEPIITQKNGMILIRSSS